MVHSNAALTPRHRLKVAKLVVEHGVPIAEVAARFQCSWPTVKRWVERYRNGEGMQDRSSRPRTSPNKTTSKVVKRIVSLRLRKRIGPAQLAVLCGVAPSTAHQVLTRCRLNRLSYLDRATGEVVRRYERDQPGDLLHVDVTKFGKIPDGGGWRFVGKAQGFLNRAKTEGKPQDRSRHSALGYCFVHTVVDDHSRVAYAEIHDDEKAVTAAGVLRRATAWFADRNVHVKRVISDNGSCYRSTLRQQTCAELGITPKWTRPYRPQTNGKIERFHRTLTDGWAYARCYQSENERNNALGKWLHDYNHHRPHSACGGQPPITRLTNLPDQYS